MKVIDLLNKIANENFLPKEVNSRTGSISYYLYDKCGKECDDRNLHDMLNEDLEIIEDEKKIPEKLKRKDFLDNFGGLTINDGKFINKINEILDYLKSKGE